MNKIFILLTFTLLISNCLAQTINYQGVMRDLSGQIMADQPLDLRFRLLRDTMSPNQIDYEEFHRNVTTNAFGVFQTSLGRSHPDSLSQMDFSIPYFIEVALKQPEQTEYLVLHRSHFTTSPYALYSAKSDPQLLSFDSDANKLSISGGNAITIPTGGTDADSDPSNEIQQLSKQGNKIKLSGGGEVEDAVIDADADPNNEIQMLSREGEMIRLSDGGAVRDEVQDDDSDPTNEIQELKLNGNKITLSKNGGSVTINEAETPWDKRGNNSISYPGKVGIGTTNPSEELEIKGTVKSEQVTTKKIQAPDKSTAGWTSWIEFKNNADINIVPEQAQIMNITRNGANISGNTLMYKYLTVGASNYTNKPKMNILFGADASLGTDGYLLVGPKAGANVVLDNNEIMARNNGKTSSLFLQHDGGNLVILQKGIGKGGVGIGLSNPSHILHVNGVARSFQSTWATSSDRRVKNDVSSIQNAMSIVSKLRPVTFKWDATYRPSDTLIHHGFIAQEVEETMPTWTQQVEEKVGEELIDDFRTLNTSDLVPILTRAIQEQQEVILEQKSIMQVMQSQIDELTADITTLMTSLNPEK